MKSDLLVTPGVSPATHEVSCCFPFIRQWRAYEEHNLVTTPFHHPGTQPPSRTDSFNYPAGVLGVKGTILHWLPVSEPSSTVNWKRKGKGKKKITWTLTLHQPHIP